MFCIRCVIAASSVHFFFILYHPFSSFFSYIFSFCTFCTSSCFSELTTNGYKLNWKKIEKRGKKKILRLLLYHLTLRSLSPSFYLFFFFFSFLFSFSRSFLAISMMSEVSWLGSGPSRAGEKLPEVP